MLSAIVQKVTGTTLLQYLTPRLFEPLGIENPTWEVCPRGINTGGWGLSIRTEDIARFGQMYLQKGMWDGKQILPAAWIEEATRKQVSNEPNTAEDWRQGYGYQFWRCRYGVYRGDGAFGQYCIVMPDQDAVLAITGGVGDMQAVLNQVWRHLLENMQPRPLRKNAIAWEQLNQKTERLSLPGLTGINESPLVKEIAGRKFTIKKNKVGVEAVRFDFDQNGCLFTLHDRFGEHRVYAGIGHPRQGTTNLFLNDSAETPAVTSAVWLNENTLLMKLQLTRTPFSWTINCQFMGNNVILKAATNVSFGPTKLPRLTGTMARES